MPLYYQDDERTLTWKDLFKDYLQDPSPAGVSSLREQSDILVRAGLEVIGQKIGEMCVMIYTASVPKSPSAKFTAFGTNWINQFNKLLSEIGFEDDSKRILFSEQLMNLLNGPDQDLAELSALVLCNPLFLYADHVENGLLEAYNNSSGHGKRLAIAFAIMKVKMEPDYFEHEIFQRLPPELSPDEIKQEYSKLMSIHPDLRMAKIVVLDRWLSHFLMEIIILDIGLHGTSWRSIWPDWTREKEI